MTNPNKFFESNVLSFLALMHSDLTARNRSFDSIMVEQCMELLKHNQSKFEMRKDKSCIETEGLASS